MLENNNVAQLTSSGMKGLMLAVMLSAVVSSLTSQYNSVATVITMDIWARFRKSASSRELLIIGRFVQNVLLICMFNGRRFLIWHTL